MIPGPYERRIFHGKLLDNATISALEAVEDRLGYELTIVQGIGGAVASAGTHLEGRAVDLAAWDHARKVRALRDVGFAAWFRPTLPGVWGEHVHGVLVFDGRDNSRGLADSGFRQIGSYDRGRNGLANDGDDPNNYRPDPPAGWSREDYRRSFREDREPVRTNVTRARNQLVQAIHELGQALAFVDQVSEDREVVHRVAKRIAQERRELRALLERMPKR